ncbi:MAG TPA: hypothetical protein VH164_01170 [Ktedonobacteraceae bacterium]|jgi:hypothetical protein|nr:hypothetical protein [Ktedonobacteraceae bacterium]
MKPSELLNAGADKIEEVGWTQGSYAHVKYSYTGSCDNWETQQELQGYCALGSMRQAVMGATNDMSTEAEVSSHYPEYGKARKALKKVMLEQLETAVSKYSGMAVAMINDEAGRTKEEIVSCMRKAANTLEA